MNPLETIAKAEPSLPFKAAEEVVRAFEALGQRETRERGERLFSVGDAARGVYLIVSGSARVSLENDGGRELMCHVVGAWSLLGLPAALCSQQYAFDTQMLEKAETVFLNTEALNQVLRERPALCMQVMTMMCDELSTLQQTRDHMHNCTNESCSLHDQCIQVS